MLKGLLFFCGRKSPRSGRTIQFSHPLGLRAKIHILAIALKGSQGSCSQDCCCRKKKVEREKEGGRNNRNLGSASECTEMTHIPRALSGIFRALPILVGVLLWEVGKAWAGMGNLGK